jgi:hypothetical protein
MEASNLVRAQDARTMLLSIPALSIPMQNERDSELRARLALPRRLSCKRRIERARLGCSRKEKRRATTRSPLADEENKINTINMI